MSFVKNQMEEFERRGFGEVPKKYVCQDCVNNENWKEWIRRQALNNGRHACSYGDNRLATITLERFMSHCMEFINENYDKAWEDWGMKPDEETDEYSVDVWNTSELVNDILAEEAGIVHEELLNDIIVAIKKVQDPIWCRHDAIN